MRTDTRIFCDYCSKVIKSIDQGMLEWLMVGDPPAHEGFKIVHHMSYSPFGHPVGCYHYRNHIDGNSVHLDSINPQYPHRGSFRWFEEAQSPDRPPHRMGPAQKDQSGPFAVPILAQDDDSISTPDPLRMSQTDSPPIQRQPAPLVPSIPRTRSPQEPGEDKHEENKRSSIASKSNGDGIPTFRNIIKRLFTFEGRIGRLQYLCAWLTKWGIMLLVGWIYHVTGEDFIAIIAVIGFPFIAIFNFSTATRRLHDLNKSGLWLIPIYFILFLISVGRRGALTVDDLLAASFMNLIIVVPMMLYLFCFPSVERANKYGKLKHNVFSTNSFTDQYR